MVHTLGVGERTAAFKGRRTGPAFKGRDGRQTVSWRHREGKVGEEGATCIQRVCGRAGQVLVVGHLAHHADQALDLHLADRQQQVYGACARVCVSGPASTIAACQMLQAYSPRHAMRAAHKPP